MNSLVSDRGRHRTAITSTTITPTTYEIVGAPVVVPAAVVAAKVQTPVHTIVKPPVIRKIVSPPVVSATGAPQAYALAALGAVQYTCLANVVHGENPGWIVTRYNQGGSGAYGIPQALPGSKMASAGADWRTNGVTQVKWMITYMDGRYGSACGAWSYWQRHSNY